MNLIEKLAFVLIGAGTLMAVVTATLVFGIPNEEPAKAGTPVPGAEGVELTRVQVNGAIPCIIAHNGGSGAIALSCNWVQP